MMMKKVILVGLFLSSISSYGANWKHIQNDNKEEKTYIDQETFQAINTPDGDRQVSAWFKSIFKTPFLMPDLKDETMQKKIPAKYYQLLVQARCVANTYKVASLSYYDAKGTLIIDTLKNPELKEELQKEETLPPFDKFDLITPDRDMASAAAFLCQLDSESNK